MDVSDNEIDITKLRYVLYARKSTDDPQRQVRSIPDQIAECKLLAIRLGLHVVKTLQETKSAKQPNQRFIFSQMLKDIKAGKYDAILCWNPDRLSRNMLEAGMIIDFVDTGIIQDLKFVTHPFERSANGLMLLGMSFVLSKQYSDDLSQKVTRGVRRSFLEGKSPAPKHGYVRDKDGYYQPDGKNFELICKAWQMRKEGIALETISNYMNDNGYGRIIKRTGKRVRMDKRILSDIFRDPFYFGILVQADQEVDLRNIYNFTPAVSKEDYDEVQQLSFFRMRPTKPHRMTFFPLRLMVRCSYCGRNMVVGASKGHKRYLYYRCDNPDCTRKKRSIRGKVIFDFIYQFLGKGLNFTEKEYSNYYTNLTVLSTQKREKLQIEVHSKEALLKKTERDIKEIALGILKIDKKSTIWKVNEDKVAELEAQKLQLEGDISKLREQLTDSNKDKLSIDQVLNLSRNAAVIVKAANVIVKDQICRLIFLNFSVNEEKILSYQLKEPFATLLKQRQLLPSRGVGN